MCRPPPGYCLSRRRRDHERRRVPSRGRGGAGAPHRVPHPAPQPTPSQTSRSGALGRAESRAKGGERRSPHPRPPTERTGPARAPRSASRIPPSKIWNRWRGAALTRTSFGGSFCVPRPEHGAALAREQRRTTARPLTEPRPARAPRTALRRSHLYKRWKGGKQGQLTRAHPPPPPPRRPPPPFLLGAVPGQREHGARATPMQPQQKWIQPSPPPPVGSDKALT